VSNTEIIILPGSIRTGSLNMTLAKNAAELIERAGGNSTLIDLKEFEVPLYNQDIQDNSGFPEDVIKLQELFSKASGFFILSPEYNGYFTPLLKNVLDWTSRETDTKKMLECFLGKYTAIGAASPGPLGGMRAIMSLRQYLSNLGLTVLTPAVSVPQAHNKFSETGALIDNDTLSALEQSINNLLSICKK
jgi:NAD(P)H-dependent FMN reductase